MVVSKVVHRRLAAACTVVAWPLYGSDAHPWSHPSCRELNTAIREELKARGQIGPNSFDLPILINRQEITGEDRKRARSYRAGDTVRYLRGSDALDLEPKSYAVAPVRPGLEPNYGQNRDRQGGDVQPSTGERRERLRNRTSSVCRRGPGAVYVALERKSRQQPT
jgi:hypothetical protein